MRWIDLKVSATSSDESHEAHLGSVKRRSIECTCTSYGAHSIAESNKLSLPRHLDGEPLPKFRSIQK